MEVCSLKEKMIEKERELELLNEAVDKIKNPKLPYILRVQQSILRAVDDYMYKNKITRMMPLMMAPITDTLNHSVEESALFYQGQEFDVMKSMIFHKQATLMNKGLEKIYIVSPNIRLESSERGDKRHLFEFTQVDFEFKEGTMEMVFEFMESLVRYVFEFIKKECTEEFKALGLTTDHLELKDTFKKYRTEELEEKYGEDFERIASEKATEPFWIINHKREFYDAEDLDNKGTYKNYDLIWPKGYVEGLSGGEREYKYDRIITRMREINQDEERFKDYIELAKRGELVKTAGAGFGVERMTRFICQLNQIDDATVFTRKPGKEKYIF
ncbi:asparagine synthetase A [Clostridium oceanicum]|uniref:Asparagine synthetase A n=1 Tax=Clostridium oceanicum TaxID=1543 RepID=A0ABN1JGU7_9CLOT